MKKLLFIFALCSLLCSCANDKVINGVSYPTYGFLNESRLKCDSIYYEASGWACVSGIVFSGMIVPPIYIFGYSLYEPRMSMADFRKYRLTK